MCSGRKPARLTTSSLRRLRLSGKTLFRPVPTLVKGIEEDRRMVGRRVYRALGRTPVALDPLRNK
jgi:hypothetical protein